MDGEPCPNCSGKGERDGVFCRECWGRGMWTIRECPYQVVPSSTWNVLRLSHLADKGAWPVRGGVLDQAQSAIDAFGLIETYIAKAREDQNGGKR